MTNIKNLVKDVVASPLGEVIASVGQGVADAQSALDEGSLNAVLDIYSEGDDEKQRLLQEIGYRPTFYSLPETTGEVRVALRLGNGASGAGNAVARRPVLTNASSVSIAPSRVGLNAALGKRMYATPVDAGYANQYGFSADVSAKLTFKIMPVPPPDGADELRRVPNVVGVTADDAQRALGALGLVMVVQDADGQTVTSFDETKKVDAQIPASTEIVRLEDEVAVRLKA